MNDKIVKFNLSQRKNKNIPELQAGDIVKVYRKIIEGKKERVQIFEGIVIAVNGKQSSSPTVTVRKVSNGVGVELVLPIFSPNVEKIEIIKKAKVRRSKLYYIRNKSAKSMRLKYKDMADFAAAEEEKEEEPSVEVSKEDLSVLEESSDENVSENKKEKDSKEKEEVKTEDNKKVMTEEGKKEETKKEINYKKAE